MSDEQQQELHRVTVNFIPKAWSAVEATAERLGLSKTDTINRAVQAYAFLEEEIAGGAEVFLQAPGGKVSAVKFG